MRMSDWSSDVCSSDLTLLLATRQRMRIPVPIPGHAHSPEDGIDTRTSVRCGDAIEAESDVLSDRQMGKESVVLKDETDPPPFRRQVERRVCDEDRKSTRLNSSH